jgi:peptidoglycan/xylan/chitin deacetylase (PgdA/CDA1 family)
VTSYVFHYDLEKPDLCLKAAPRLAELHRRHNVPATFFLLGTTLERCGSELRAIFGDDPLFDLQSHTYSHGLLKDNQVHGPGIGLAALRREIDLGIDRVEHVFERPCIGVRSGCGFYRGLRGCPERLQVIRDSGARYLSSDLRGPSDSMPAGLVQAYRYDADGVPELLELPGHGWHDNTLKGFDTGLRLHWPPVLSWGIPRRPPSTPEEEYAVQRVWVQRAVELELDYISPVYHPHSVYRMTPDCRSIELVMRHLAEEGIPTTTYTALYERYQNDPESLPGTDAWSWEAEVAGGQETVELGTVGGGVDAR